MLSRPPLRVLEGPHSLRPGRQQGDSRKAYCGVRPRPSVVRKIRARTTASREKLKVGVEMRRSNSSASPLKTAAPANQFSWVGTPLLHGSAGAGVSRPMPSLRTLHPTRPRSTT